MSANNANNYDPMLVPELGDVVTFAHDSNLSETGIIIYHDGNTMIRIKTIGAELEILDFPLVDGLFDESLGITDVTIHQKRIYPHFSKQLGVMSGSHVDFYSINAENAIVFSGNGIITNVIATDTQDAIELEGGNIIDFGFIGPPAPYVHIEPKLPVAQSENEQSRNEETNAAEIAPEEDSEALAALANQLLNEAVFTVESNEERIYDDAEQRQDMYISLLANVSTKRQKDPRVMQRFYHITDQLLGLKNSIMDTNRKPISYTVSTVHDILSKHVGKSIPAVLPIASVKKQLYSDIRTSTENDTHTDVNITSIAHALYSMSIPKRTPDLFARYIGRMLDSDPLIPMNDPSTFVEADYDVIRSVIPSKEVQPQGIAAVAGAIDMRNKKPIDINLYEWINSESTAGETTTRLLRESRVKGTDADIIIARADPADIVANILLSPELTARRSNPRSSVLLWDINASEESRKSYAFTHNDVLYTNKPTFYKELVTVRAADQHVLTDDVSVAAILQTRMNPVLSITNAHTTEILDSFGLANLELTEEMMTSIDDALTRGQATWQATFSAMDQRIKTSLTLPTAPAVPPSVINSTLFSDALLSNPVIQVAVDELRAKETTLKQHDLTLTSGLIKVAEGTLIDVLYDAASGAPLPEITTNRERMYTLEAARKERIRDVKRTLIKEYQSTPDINPCEHVHNYGLLKGVKSDPIRMLLFKKFLQTYQGKQKGAYIQCNICYKDLVCKHELLLLHEYLNRDRADALHKQLLLDYSGTVFEGAYICKICGQSIRALDYDTSLEYDDEGRPLVGRSVIEPDDDEGFLTLAEEVREGSNIPRDEEEYHSLVRVIFEAGGMIATPEMYVRVRTCMKKMPPSDLSNPAAYADFAARIKSTVTHQQYIATEKLCTLAAFVVLELQTSDIAVPFPAQECTFSRDGFPLTKYDPKSTTPSAISYVACAFASIRMLSSPWKDVKWSNIISIKDRTLEAKKGIELAIGKIMGLKIGLKPATPIEGITSVYRDLYTLYEQKKHAVHTDLPSYSDRVPSSFRPLPHAVDTYATTPIQNVRTYQQSVQESVDNGVLTETYEHTVARQEDISHEIIHAMHEVSKPSAFIEPKSTKSESSCCARPLADVRATGFGVASAFGDESHPLKEEMGIVRVAYDKLRRRDPALPASGTHIYVPWSAPEIPVIAPAADESVYYTLFMKHCATDGNVHEFQRGVSNYAVGLNLPADANADEESNYVCRRCGFKYPASMDYLVPSNIAESNPKKLADAIQHMHASRKAIALEALESQGISVEKDAYDELDRKIRLRRAFVQPSREPESDATQFTKGLQSLDAVVQYHFAPQAGAAGAANATTVNKWIKLRDAMQSDDIMKQDKRSGLLRPFLTDAQILGDTIARLTDNDIKQLYYSSLETQSSIPSRLVSFLQQAFVTNAYNVGSGITITSDGWSPNKWIDGITMSHKEDIYKAWVKYSTVMQNMIEKLHTKQPEEQECIGIAMQHFAAWIGDWLRVWHTEIRIGTTIDKPCFTVQEQLYILRWVVNTGLYNLFTDTSFYYEGYSSETKHTATQFAITWFKQTIAHYGKHLVRYNMSEKDIKEELLKRTTLERAIFLKKFDDESDMELRKLALTRKKLKIGAEWTTDTRNQGPYRGDTMEHRREQMLAMGIRGNDLLRAEDAPRPEVNMHEYADHNKHGDDAE